MRKAAKFLAVAAATGRVAAVYVEDRHVIDQRMSRTAAKSPDNARRIVRGWLDSFNPDLVITEDPRTTSRKGSHIKTILSSIDDLFEASEALNIRTVRNRNFKNKYEQAQALVKRYPEMKAKLPSKPPVWMPEPRNMTYFEALALLDQTVNP